MTLCKVKETVLSFVLHLLTESSREARGEFSKAAERSQYGAV